MNTRKKVSLSIAIDNTIDFVFHLWQINLCKNDIDTSYCSRMNYPRPDHTNFIFYLQVHLLSVCRIWNHEHMWCGMFYDSTHSVSINNNVVAETLKSGMMHTNRNCLHIHSRTNKSDKSLHMNNILKFFGLYNTTQQADKTLKQLKLIGLLLQLLPIAD